MAAAETKPTAKPTAKPNVVVFGQNPSAIKAAAECESLVFVEVGPSPTVQELLASLQSVVVQNPETVVVLATTPNVVCLGALAELETKLGDKDLVMCGAASRGFTRDLIADAADSTVPSLPALLESFAWWQQRVSEIGTNAKFKRVNTKVVVGRARAFAVVLSVFERMNRTDTSGVWRWYTTIGQHTRIAQELSMPRAFVDDDCDVVAAVSSTVQLYSDFTPVPAAKRIANKKTTCTPTLVVLENSIDPNYFFDFCRAPRTELGPSDPSVPTQAYTRVVLFPAVCAAIVLFLVFLARDL